MTQEFDVIIIGGGATGGGTALDLALRGLRVALVERADLTDGTSGRYHGLLHSGGRYAVRDPESARECIEENRILRRIVPHAIEDTGGFFVTTPDDDPTYADKWLKACHECDIEAAEISVAQMLKEEPALNPAITRAFRVPDASSDSFDVLTALGAAIQAQHGTVLTYHEVVGLTVAGGKVTGATVRNRRTGDERHLAAALIVNAAGAWAGQIAGMAGCPVTVRPSKGTMVAMAYRFVNTIINRCHTPGDGDILVPVGTVAVIGTTSVNVPDPNDTSIQPWEVRKLLEEGEKMVPGFSQVRGAARLGGRPTAVRRRRRGAGPRGQAHLRRARSCPARRRQRTDHRGRRQVHHLPADGRARRGRGLRSVGRDEALRDQRLCPARCARADAHAQDPLAGASPGRCRDRQTTGLADLRVRTRHPLGLRAGRPRPRRHRRAVGAGRPAPRPAAGHGAVPGRLLRLPRRGHPA